MFNYLSILVGVFYIAMGIFVIIYKFFIVQLEPITAYLLGALLLSYGIFRITRATINIRKSKNEN